MTMVFAGEIQPELTELHSFIQIGMPSLVEHFVLGFVHVVELLPGATAPAPHNSCSIGDKLVTFTTADIRLQLEVTGFQSDWLLLLCLWRTVSYSVRGTLFISYSVKSNQCYACFSNLGSLVAARLFVIITPTVASSFI